MTATVQWTPATPRQVSYLNDMMNRIADAMDQGYMPSAQMLGMTSYVTADVIRSLRSGVRPSTSFARAKKLITITIPINDGAKKFLVAQGAVPTSTGAPAAPNGPGMYYREPEDNENYDGVGLSWEVTPVIKISKTRTPGKTTMRRLVVNRSRKSGRFINISFRYRQGVPVLDQYRALRGGLQPLLLDKATKMGLSYNVCVVCGRTLTDPFSVARGIGPVCIKRVEEQTKADAAW